MRAAHSAKDNTILPPPRTIFGRPQTSDSAWYPEPTSAAQVMSVHRLQVINKKHKTNRLMVEALGIQNFTII